MLDCRIAVHGHRGARAVFAENTMPAFVHAIDAGADFIELDVVATRDDVVVVCHDPVLTRRIYTGPRGTRVVRELTLQELRGWDCGSVRLRRFPRQVPVPGARIPTLEQVFELAGRGDFQFNVEAKSHPRRPWQTPPPERFAELLVESARRRGLEARVVVQSFDFRLLHAVRRLAPDLRTAALCGLRGARDFVAVADAAGAGIVGPYHRMVNRRRVEAAHAAGIRVVPWTANRPRDWARLVHAGVDGIITDDPAQLIEWLRSQGLRR